MIRNIFNKIRKKVLSPEKYARYIGVNMGENNFVPDKETWSSEPYLITVGNNCQITMGVRIFTHGGGQAIRHQIPDFDAFGKVVIEDYVYIGNNALIMPGVTIGDNTVIGAGSVVTKDIPANVVAYGIPCKVIREINEHDKEYYFKDRKIEL